MLLKNSKSQKDAENCATRMVFRYFFRHLSPTVIGVTVPYYDAEKYPLVNVYIANWKITIDKFGNSTISMGHYHYLFGDF